MPAKVYKAEIPHLNSCLREVKSPLKPEPSRGEKQAEFCSVTWKVLEKSRFSLPNIRFRRNHDKPSRGYGKLRNKERLGTNRL